MTRRKTNQKNWDSSLRSRMTKRKESRDEIDIHGRALPCVIQSGVCGAKNPGPCVGAAMIL